MSVGHSSANTPTKHDRFAAIAAVMRIAAAAVGNWKWGGEPTLELIDLTAGDGVISATTPDPSPLALLRIARAVSPTLAKRDVRPRLTLVEKQRQTYWRLQESIAQAWGADPAVDVSPVVLADHCKWLRDNAGRFNKTTFGLVYIDPNGARVPVDLINDLVDRTKLDVVVHFSGTSTKRDPLAPSPRDIVEGIHRDHGWVTWNSANDPWQWTMAVLSNYPEYGNKVRRDVGLQPLDGATAQQHLDRISRTRAEWREACRHPEAWTSLRFT